MCPAAGGTPEPSGATRSPCVGPWIKKRVLGVLWACFREGLMEQWQSYSAI